MLVGLMIWKSSLRGTAATFGGGVVCWADAELTTYSDIEWTAVWEEIGAAYPGIF